MEIRCILNARSALAEGAVWSPEEQALYWLDQMRPEIHRFDPVTGKDVRFDLDLPAQLGGLVPLGDGGMALAASDGITLLSMAETKCARWRRKSVPVWLIKKGGDALASVCLV